MTEKELYEKIILELYKMLSVDKERILITKHGELYVARLMTIFVPLQAKDVSPMDESMRYYKAPTKLQALIDCIKGEKL